MLKADPSASSADLTDALPILQAKYPYFKELHYKPGDQLSDLITRSNGKISLTPPETAKSPPVVTATLPDGLLYWRMASFALPSGKEWSDLNTEKAQPSVHGVILDLRSNTAPDDYDGLNHIYAFFGPVSQPSSLPVDALSSKGSLFPFPTIVLVDRLTTGAAEDMAGHLQANGAVVVGQPTAGKAGPMETHPLASGQVLRFLSDASDHSWGHPIVPDIALTISDHTEKTALMLIGHNRVTDVIQESPARHRMSEAALVKGDDPEWDAYLATLEKKDDTYMSLPPVHDPALLTALDSLRAIAATQAPPTFAPAVVELPPAPTSGFVMRKSSVQ